MGVSEAGLTARSGWLASPSPHAGGGVLRLLLPHRLLAGHGGGRAAPASGGGLLGGSARRGLWASGLGARALAQELMSLRREEFGIRACPWGGCSRAASSTASCGRCSLVAGSSAWTSAACPLPRSCTTWRGGSAWRSSAAARSRHSGLVHRALDVPAGVGRRAPARRRRGVRPCGSERCRARRAGLDALPAVTASRVQGAPEPRRPPRSPVGG